MNSRLLRLLAPVLLIGLALPAFSAPSRPAAAPTLPKGAYAYWHAGKVMQKKGELTLVDLIGGADIAVTTPALTVASGGAFAFDGSQVDGVRAPAKQPVSNRFTLGVDIKPDAEGLEHQSIAYLYRFCELRYRKSRGELTLNVWQTSPDEPGKELVSSAVLPLPAGKWSRVQAVIDDKVARLVVDGVPSEIKLTGSWELLPPSVVLLLGKGGADRAYRGEFDHLYLAIAP